MAGLAYALPDAVALSWSLITPGRLTQVEYWRDVLLHFTTPDGTVIADDTIPAHVPAVTLLGTNMPNPVVTLFDNRSLWYVLTVPGSHALSLCLASQIANLSTILPGGSWWAILARVLPTRIVDYEP